MILYIESEHLNSTQCQDVDLCNRGLNNEYLLVTSSKKCSCPKQRAILCKYDHDTCQNRCSMNGCLLIKQERHSNNILIDNRPTNVVVLKNNELKNNAEIIYICHRNNLPETILEHLKDQLTTTNELSIDSSISPTATVGFLLKHSVLAQSIYGMFLILQQARWDGFKLRRHAHIGYLLVNICLGMLCSFMLYRNFDLYYLISNEILIQAENLTTWLKSIIEWLMHAPAGLKLNQPLVDFLARFYFYHIYLWSGYLEALVMTVVPHLYKILIILCIFGISLAIGAICDFIRLLSIHLYCFYIYAARLFNWQVRLLISLFRLFCGKKQNPLRDNRLDSHLCDIDQLFIVTLSFTILLFLLPTVFMFYFVFTTIWTIAILTVKFIQYVNRFLLRIPIYEFYLCFTGSQTIRGTPRMTINYSDSSENTVCFNFLFDPVSLFELYHVCNIHTPISSLSCTKLLLAILKGQPIIMNNGPFTLFDRYEVGCELGKGTYGIVRKAFDSQQQRDVAIKCVCLGEEGIPSTALREISLLRSLKHPNIIRLHDIKVHQPTGELFLFYECMEMDLYEYMKLYRKALPEDLSRSYLKQILLGIDYVHSNAMLHRDLKPQNILIDWFGALKLADFGLGRHFQLPMRMYTHEVVTLWYRSPEILLGAKIYTTSVDLWSVGAIFAEITHNRALFAGECEIDQLFRIFRTLGTPDDKIWPSFSSMPDHKKSFPQWKPQSMAQLLPNLSPDALHLTLQMLTYDPDRRITAKEALESVYLQSMSDHLIIPQKIVRTKTTAVNENTNSSND